jgi:serine O-acetyltransferase
MNNDLDAWLALREEVAALMAGEPMLATYLESAVLRQASLGDCLAYILADKLATRDVTAEAIGWLIRQALSGAVSIGDAIRLDLIAIVSRDPAAGGLANAFLNHKGYHALQSHRMSHWAWNQGRRPLAHFLQNRANEVFAIDIHPAARLGTGIFIDHGTGVVIGETSVVGDDVSILQDVTLGGSGKQAGDRHPKVGRGVLIGAGAKILGNVHIGEGSKVGAGSVVLTDVPAHKTVVGVPARIVGTPAANLPGLEMDQQIDEADPA